MLELALLRREQEQQRTERSRIARVRWWTVIRCTAFVAKLLVIRRLNAYAELIKETINTHWRGYQLRASMKVYLQQMRYLQFSMRACVRMRKHICHYIYMPILWEVETAILADVIAMPKASVEEELEKHRAKSDLKAHLQKVRVFSDFRAAWQTSERIGPNPTRSSVMTQHTVHTVVSNACQFYNMAAKRTHGRRRSQGDWGMPHASESVSQPQTDRAVALHSRERASHPLMEVIDKYRLPSELRQSIVHKMLRESVDRWWLRYQEYKDQRETFKKLWQNWRLEICALGPHNRHVWPLCPAIPRLPSEITKVDEKWLHAQVHAALRQTQAGQLL